MAHLFISYARKNKAEVERLLGDLHKARHTTWYDQLSIQGGDDWRLSLERGIADSDLVLVALSPEAVASEWISRELAIAYNQHKPILPVVIVPTRSADFPSIVKQGHLNVVYLQPSYEDGLAKLLTDLRGAPTGSERIPFFVAYPRLVHFAGRDDDLRRLHTLLRTAGPRGLRPTGLFGMGGIGKTQLAVEYAYRYRYFYPDGVFFLNAAGDWGEEFADFSLRLGLELPETTEGSRRERMISTMAAYLRDHGNALLIFDNASTAAELQHREIGLGIKGPQLPCSVLFTTRKRFDANGLCPLEVLLFSLDASRAVLTHYRPDLKDEGTVDNVCSALGFLPLALELGAIFLKKKPKASPQSYLDYLKARGADATHAAARLKSEDLQAYYEASVRPALRAQWELLETKEAKTFMCLVALHDETARVPAARLGAMSMIFDAEDGIDTPVADGILDAHSASLLQTFADDTVRLHPLVADFLKHPVSDDPPELREFDPGALAREAAANTLQAYVDLSRLETAVAQRGVQAVEQDMKAAQELLRRSAGAAAATSLQSQLSAFLSVIRLESHTLLDWNKEAMPALPAQQILFRSAVLGDSKLADAAECRLEDLGRPYVKLLWRMPQEPGGLVRTLSGHAGRIHAIAISSDGGLSATAAHDDAARVWDLEAGYELRSLAGHGTGATSIAFSPDASRVVTGSGDGVVRIFDTVTGNLIHALVGHEGEVYAIVVSPDGRRVASGAADGEIKLWDIASGELLLKMSGDPYINPYTNAMVGIRRLFASADSHSLVSVGHQMLHLWDLKTGQLRHAIKTDNIQTVAVSSDCRIAITGEFEVENPLKFWHLESGRLLAELHPHWPNGPRVDDVAMTKNGKYAFSSSTWDNRIFVYNPETASEYGHLRTPGGVDAIAPTGDDRKLASLSGGRLQIWDVETGRQLRSIEGFTIIQGSVVALDPAGRFAITGEESHDGGSLRVWDLDKSAQSTRSGGHKDAVLALAISPDSRRVVSASADGAAIVWDLRSGRRVSALHGHRSQVGSVAFADGKTVVTGSKDSTLRVWDAKSGRLLRELVGHGATDRLSDRLKRRRESDRDFGVEYEFGEITDFKLMPGGERLVSASKDGTVRIWDLHSGRQIHVLYGHDDRVYSVDTTPDGGLIISCGLDNAIRVWDAVRGQQLYTMALPETKMQFSSVTSKIRVSPDGSSCLGNPGDALVIWNIRDGTLRTTLEPGEEFPFKYGVLDWNPDGSRVFAACARLGIWDAASGKNLHVLGSFQGTSYIMTALGVSNDGQWCVSSWITVPVIEIWNLERAELLASIDLGREIQSIRIAPDQRTFVCGDGSGGVYCFAYVEPAGKPRRKRAKSIPNS
jgi:WD40 repeat protein